VSPALRISWTSLLAAAPTILTAASELVGRLGDRRRGQLDAGLPPANAAEHLLRVEALEASIVSQAEITREMAGQLKEITEALRVVARRALLALGFSIAATALALVAVIRSFL
jgi:hypothetical protein